MKNYQPVHSFDSKEAAALHDHRGDEEEAVDFLASLAGEGPALELAIGTGRLALPLVARGIPVDGIDLSPVMVERLRGKPGGEALNVVIGDIAEVPVPGRYPLVYLAWNTLYNLLTQEDQIRCFENVAAHLTSGGRFVVEGYVPSYLYRMESDQRVEAEHIGVDSVRLDVLRHDPATQTLEESHVTLSESGVRLTPVVHRYAWPSELDLMARLAGLQLESRFGGWSREAFDSKSELHVSVYVQR